MDADQAYGEKAWQESHKNAAGCIEQILEAESHKKANVQLQTINRGNHWN